MYNSQQISVIIPDMYIYIYIYRRLLFAVADPELNLILRGIGVGGVQQGARVKVDNNAVEQRFRLSHLIDL